MVANVHSPATVRPPCLAIWVLYTLAIGSGPPSNVTGMRRRQQVLLAARCSRASPFCASPPVGLMPRGRCAQMFAELSAEQLGGALRGGALTQRTRPPSERQRLRSDPDPAVRWAPPASVAAAAMAGDGDSAVRALVAADSGCPKRALRPLASDSDSAVRSSVAANTSCPARLLDKLALDAHPAVRSTVAANPNSEARTLAALASDSDSAVRSSVAANTSCPASTLAALAADDDFAVRTVVAGNTSCPPETLSRLAASKTYGSHDIEVFDRLAGNPSATPETLRAAASIVAGGTFAERLAQNPACPFDLLEHLAFSTCMHKEPPCDDDECRWDDDEDRTAVLAAVLSNPGSSEGGGWLRGYIEETLALNGGDVGARIASVVAETSAEYLADWATHDDEYVRAEVAANAHTDAATLTSLKDDHGDGVQASLAENPSCPPEVLCALAEDGFGFTHLVGNASCPAEALDVIAENGDSEEREAAAAHPNIGPRAVEALAADDDLDALEALVANPACPWETALSVCGPAPDSEMLQALARRTLCPAPPQSV